jgi:hypothetical protein
MQELPVGAPGLESFPWQLRAVEFCFGGWVSRSPAVIIGGFNSRTGPGAFRSSDGWGEARGSKLSIDPHQPAPLQRTDEADVALGLGRGTHRLVGVQGELRLQSTDRRHHEARRDVDWPGPSPGRAHHRDLYARTRATGAKCYAPSSWTMRRPRLGRTLMRLGLDVKPIKPTGRPPRSNHWDGDE